ncbi:primosomal protein N' [Enterococcus sp. MMGLQ5-2]|nr:primosomal protein N' [Enterococcus sp. MMGLQ5-2]MBS7584263.1 primosomal protein N' [Enterococcus sp. MMGLQ5-1]NPD12119.1 primosomal protein N' [Enterococcus sp. MMGLQ5-1]NPD36691.1 primosomal protein N' [Enterococcus sp. MMGLQ5-2]
MQTDRAYSYLVPPELETIIERGMRVIVPFGKGGRLIQGFIISLERLEAVDFDIKQIVKTLDITPVLNDELLMLADFLKETTYAFKISCLQAMLPNLLKLDYDKEFIKLIDNQQTAAIFKAGSVISWQEASDKKLLAALQKLRLVGMVELSYLTKQKGHAKLEKRITPNDITALEQINIRKNAKKQQALLSYLKGMTEPELISQIKEQGFSTADINQAEVRGWLTIDLVEIYRKPFEVIDYEKVTSLTLNSEQLSAVKQIEQSFEMAKTFLLEGITGSGKTEVYLQLIAKVLLAGQTALMLVPEIALTPQMVTRFVGRFGKSVAVLHSGLSDGERYDEWRKIERGEARVVVGARSAIFAPLLNIGIIIIDEEHEGSYKQNSVPRYHARDVAIERSKYHRCPLVLGSATPSLESRARAQKGVYDFLRLTQRANPKASLPTVDIVDFRDYFGELKSQNFTPLLLEKIKNRLSKKEQIILLLNRRGHSSFILCRDCGYVVPCPNCEISLTLHMDTHTMNCHYCGHKEAIPQQCPNCHSKEIRYYGTGTQKVEAELNTLLPDAKVIRMDVDTTSRKGAHAKLLQRFEMQQADILLGTQMIAKGLDFSNVTLVGVLNADTALNLPDFRSSERTFQLLTQVAGRAGRAEKAGEVVIQTYNPEHYAIQLVKHQDYEAFYQREMEFRRLLAYPPYYFTVQLTITHRDLKKAQAESFRIAHQLTETLSNQAKILGPVPAFIARVKNEYFYQIMIKYRFESGLSKVLKSILAESQKKAREGLKIMIDVEPQN